MTDDPADKPAAPPPAWSPPPPYAPPPSWQPQPPPYAAPPGWQPPPPPYAAPPGWQQQPPAGGPAYGVAPYGAPGYPGYGYPQPANVNGFAIASLACAIVLGIVPLLGGALGVIFGIVAIRQCARNGERGRGLAIAGIVVGGVAIVFWVLVFIGLAVGSSPNSGTSNFGAVLW